MKKYIVVGATSMLGAEVNRQLVEKGNFVYAVVRRIPTVKFKNTKYLLYNMEDYKTFAIEEDSIEGVFYFAWEGARAPYRDNFELQKKNYVYSLEFYDSIKSKINNFYFGAGSQAEYGNYKCEYNENLECHPETQYGKYKNKVCVELMEKCKEDGIKFLWGRVFSAYGKGDYAKTLIMSLIKDLKSNKPINLSPCVHIWNFTYYKDVARAIIGLTNAESGIYNITNSDNIPLKNYVEVIKKLINDAAIINYGFYEYKNGVPDMRANNDKLVKAINYKPYYIFKDGITELLEDISNDN